MSIIASGSGWAFDSDGLLTITMTGAMPDYDSGRDVPWSEYKYASSGEYIRSVSIGNGLTHIGQYAFYDMRWVSEIVIPSGVTSIGNSAFAGTRLHSVSIPQGVTSIGANAFADTGPGDIAIPASVTSLGYNAFYSSGLSFNVDPENPNYASKDGVLFNKSMTSIIACPNGKSGAYVIPDGVTSIVGAFRLCSQLTSIAIPASVTSISNAFSNCTRLTEIYYEGTRTQWDAVTGSANTGNAPASVSIYYNSVPTPEITIGSLGNPLAAVAGAHNQLTRAFVTLRKRLVNVPDDATNNVGTLTGIIMNGVSQGTSGVVDLGTVLTDVSSIPAMGVKFTNAAAVTQTRNADILQISFSRKTGTNVEVYAEIPLTVVTDTIGTDESGWELAMATVTAKLSYQYGASWYAISPSPQWALGDGNHTLRGQWQTNRENTTFKLQLSASKGTVSVNVGAASALVYGVVKS